MSGSQHKPGSASQMLRDTLDALGAMDVVALERLSAQAESLVATRHAMGREEASEAMSLKQALSELLRSTERSLRMLRGLHSSRLMRLDEEATWAR